MAIIELSVYDIAKYEKHHAKIFENRTVEVDGEKYTMKCFCYLFTTINLSERKYDTYERDKQNGNLLHKSW